MKNEGRWLIILMILIIVAVAGSYWDGFRNGYKYGQIDAAKGDQKYFPIKKETITWEKK